MKSDAIVRGSNLRTQEIKAALRMGHVVVTESRTGKTQAIVQLMREASYWTEKWAPTIVVVPNRGYGKTLAAYYETFYGEPPRIDQIVVGSDRLRFRDEIVLVEELQINPYRGPFYAATATFSNPVTLIGPKGQMLTNDSRTHTTIVDLSDQTLSR